MRLAAVAVAAAALALGAAGASSRPAPPSYALPSWSADGTELAFASAKGPAGAVLVVGSDGKHLRRLFRTGPLSQVAWSPRGGRIAYLSRGSVVLIQRNGRGRRVVGPGADLAWAGDGTRLAFAASAAGGPIRVVDALGNGRRRVTAGTYDHSPAWSPDGGRLAFSRASSVGGPEYVYVVGADGTGLQRLGPQGASPAWSPDGTRLAFWQRTTEGVALAVYSFADAQVRVLTRTLPAFSRAPRWSPDGSLLLVTVCGAFGACRVDVAAADGSAVTRIAGGSDAAWAPDGVHIAFTMRRSCFASGIFVANVDGSGLRRITPCR